MKKYFPILALLVCAMVFALGIIELFDLRFEHGDVYPPYSSLRADPLGTMAFYESLQRIPGVSTRRDFSDSNRLPDEPHTVYLHLAGSMEEFRWISPDLYREIQDFLARDNRLVITFLPQTQADFYDDWDRTNSVERKNSEKGKELPPPRRNISGDDEENDDWISLEEEWGFQAGFQPLTADGDSYAPESVFNKTGLPLPKVLDWHSGAIFTNCDSAWRTIYARDTNAVVIERKFGGGSVVLATDSYFISNEAMTKDRHADLLAWLIGSNQNIVFDEAHLGIVETGGVATLMRKYRLHGLVAGLALLAGLFIWKNSVSLVPPPTGVEQERFIAGKDSAEGFVNLLRRSIAPRDLLAMCFQEWEKSAGLEKTSSSRSQEAKKIFAAGTTPGTEADLVETYKKISTTLGIRKPPSKS